MRRQAQPPSTCSCLSPSQLCQHQPSKPVTTHLRAKGKFTADAAEKFRGLSRGLLPAGDEAGDNESEMAKIGRRPCVLAPTLTCGHGEWRQGPGEGRRGRSYHQAFAVPTTAAVRRQGDRIRCWPRPPGTETCMPRPENTSGQLWGRMGS